MRAALGVRAEALTFRFSQNGRDVDDVGYCTVEFADIVEEGDALDLVAFTLVEIGRLREDQRVVRDPANMRPGLRIVRIDRIQQRLERTGAEPFDIAADPALTHE